MIKQTDHLAPLFLKFSEWFIAGAIIVTVAVLVMVYINYLKAKKTARNLTQKYENVLEDYRAMNHELQQKSRQISGMTLHMMTVDNNVEKLLKSTSENKMNINQIKLEIRQFYREVRSAKQSLGTIKLFFENIHPDFFETLEEQYPRLSQQDIKLIAFLKMNMTNKEISSVMNVTTGAVFQSKRRLKKKLGLKPEEKLKMFLQNFEKNQSLNHQLSLN